MSKMLMIYLILWVHIRIVILLVDKCHTVSMTSSSGLAPCDECAVNRYASSDTVCTNCPVNTATVGTGSGQALDCKG